MQRRSDVHQPFSLFQSLELYRRQSRDAVGCTPDRPSHRTNRINIATARCNEFQQLEKPAIQKPHSDIDCGHTRLACADSVTELTGNISGRWISPRIEPLQSSLNACDEWLESANGGGRVQDFGSGVVQQSERRCGSHQGSTFHSQRMRMRDTCGKPGCRREITTPIGKEQTNHRRAHRRAVAEPPITMDRSVGFSPMHSTCDPLQ